jgi:ankyrin repeat protein
MYAAYRNHPGVVQVLLKHGADLTVQNEDEMTATDLAVGQGNTAGINFSTGLQSKPRKKGHYHNKFDMHIIKPPISFILAPPTRISNLDKLFFLSCSIGRCLYQKLIRCLLQCSHTSRKMGKTWEIYSTRSRPGNALENRENGQKPGGTLEICLPEVIR